MGDDPSGSDSVQCITDLDTCCSSAQGGHRGDWYFPDGTRLPFSGNIVQNRGARRVDLFRRNNAHTLVGIYRCSISINARYVRATIYVGLYTDSGTSLILHALLEYRL